MKTRNIKQYKYSKIIRLVNNDNMIEKDVISINKHKIIN